MARDLNRTLNRNGELPAPKQSGQALRSNVRCCELPKLWSHIPSIRYLDVPQDGVGSC